MAGIDIANKVKIGLAKAGIATGNGTNAISLNKSTRTAGTPSSPGTETVTVVALVNAIIKSYAADLIDGTLILAEDKLLVAGPDVVIAQNNEINVNGSLYVVVSVDVKSPSNVPLAYLAQLRAQ